MRSFFGGLVTFTEEIHNEKLHLLCSVSCAFSYCNFLTAMLFMFKNLFMKSLMLFLWSLFLASHDTVSYEREQLFAGALQNRYT